MFQGSDPWATLVDPGQREFRKFTPTKDGQGADMVVSPFFYLRGQAGPSDIKTFPAAAASGATETVTLSLPVGLDAPEYAEVVFINHADAAVTVNVAQTVNDFVNGSGTVNPSISSGISVAASGGSAQVLLHFPFTSDGELVVTFTASATMTNGGSVGAQIRWMA